MCQARFSFGYVLAAILPTSDLIDLARSYYGVILPSVLNLIGMCGFSVLNCILGGQTLAAVSGGSLSWTYVIIFA